MQTLLQDVRYGVRMLVKNPGFTAVAVITLALGIGANTAIFSVTEAVLLRPLPYKDPDVLALLSDPQYPQDPENGGFLYSDLEAWKSQSRSFDSMAFYFRDSGFSRVTLTNPGEPEFVQGAFVSADFFPTLGVSPLLGRVFTSREENRQERVVILSYGLWLRRFGASPDAIGKTLGLNGVNSQIIGVMPQTFQFPARDQQFWAPLTTNPFWDDPALTTNIDAAHAKYFYARWQAIGRLRPGVRLQQAQAEMNTIFARLDRAQPDKNRGPGVRVVPLRVSLGETTRLALTVFLGAVFFVLLIACSNVANLVLARGTAREREMAVRAALGAGRGRLTRQLFTESVLLALVSGGIGLILAAAGVRVLVASGPPDIPRLEQAGIDGTVLAFALGVSLLAAILFGVAPAWKISQTDLNESLKAGSSAASASAALNRTRSVLVVIEFALAVMLLAGAGLLVRSFAAVENVDPGFQPDHVLTMKIALPAGSPDAVNALYNTVLERVRMLPDVQAAGAADALFELGNINNLGLRSIEGQAPEPRERWTALIWASVRGDYFQALGVPLLRGRYFSEQDGPDSPLVAIIDESMARRYWPQTDPIGKRFKGQDPRGHNDDWLTVVGVVRDMRRSGLERNPIPHVFEPYGQAIDGERTPHLVVRSTHDPRALAATLRSLVRGLNSAAILSPVTTIEQQLSEQLTPRRFQMSLLGLFSLIALLLASVGVYGVLHYSVAERTHEIGIRMALGAQPRDVMRLVIGGGAKLALVGIALGVGAAINVTSLMTGLLFSVTPTDPVAFAGVAVLLTSVALVACYVPARRAMRVDPAVALKNE